jgi:hypothetical protein
MFGAISEGDTEEGLINDITEAILNSPKLK